MQMAVRRYDYFFDLRGPMSWTGIRIVPRQPNRYRLIDLHSTSNRLPQSPWKGTQLKIQHSSKKSGSFLIGFLRGDMHWSAVKIVSESLYYNQNSAQSDFFWYCENMIKMLIDATDRTTVNYISKLAVQYYS